MKKLISLFFLACCSVVSATNYYVATNGNDLWNGKTLSTPWKSWLHAFETAVAGDTVFFRGGVWYPTDRMYLTGGYNSHSGTNTKYICYFAYPGEEPILDCINKTVNGEALFFQDVSYIHLKGLTIRNNKESYNDDLDASGFAFQFGSGIIIENCKSHDNGCRGFYFAEVYSVLVLNCDSYNNISAKSFGTVPGNHGEGLIFTGHTTGQPFSNNVTVRGCRAWGNSDSGFGSNCGGVETWENNWSWDNGRLQGEGCGFKYTPGAWLGTGIFSRIMHGNIAAHNGFGTSDPVGTGFTENAADFDFCNVLLDNNFSYGNKAEGFETHDANNKARTTRLTRNNISYANSSPFVWHGSSAPNDTYNSWNTPPGVTLSNADFVSLDYTQLARPRKADGSLPDIDFGKLVPGSDLIDAGTTATGLTYYGSAPDLGVWEYEPSYPVYKTFSAVIENATPNKLEMTYSLSLANIIPSTSAFTVIVNSSVRGVNAVDISGPKVILTLISPIIFGDVVTVAYTKPLTNPLQTTTGGQAESMGPQSVKNNVAPPIPVYISSVIENATPALLEMTYSLALANVVPATSSFIVRVNSINRAVSSVSISGTKVSLNLVSQVVFGDAVTVAYTKPASNFLQTDDGGLAVSISPQNVINNVAPSVPSYISSVIQNATPTKLEMTYSLSLANIVPAASTFTVIINSSPRSLSTVEISGTKVILTLDSPVVNGDVVTVAYTKPSSNPLQTTLGGQAVSINAQSVINNCSPASNQPPVVNISSPTQGSIFTSPATITIDAVASDPDGTISKVEFFNGNVKLGERTLTPYSYSWNNVTEGNYLLVVIATDNLNSKTVSTSVSVTVEKMASSVNQPPIVSISSPGDNSSFEAPAIITLTADASDSDGFISKVEYFNGSVKIGESSTAPYTFLYHCSNDGSYEIFALATDNLGATDTSSIKLSVTIPPKNPDLINLFPNPNDGRFSIIFISSPPSHISRVTIVNLAGKIVYNDIMTDEEYTRQFDLSNSDPGTYVLMIISGIKILTAEKFIKK